VQEAWGDIQVPKVVVVKQEGLLPAESRGFSSDVDQHVVYSTVSAANEFGLAGTGAAVHAADHSLHRSGLGVLHEGGSGAGRVEIGVEDVRVECSGEKPSFVMERLWDQDEHIGEVGLFYEHLEMVS
jgi:hypothetical protein